MAKQYVTISDLTGELVPESKRVQIRVSNGATIGVLEVSADEEIVHTLLASATMQKARGRKPKSGLSQVA